MFFFQFAIKKYKYKSTQNYCSACSFRGVKLGASHFGRKSFDNTVLRTIFGPKKNEVTGELRGLHNEPPYYIHTLANILQVIKS
jgi:hypothetical protein